MIVTAFIVGTAFPIALGFAIKAGFNYIDAKKASRQAVFNAR